jgi:predicted Zn-ribbon and HTH transcriptional regulator
MCGHRDFELIKNNRKRIKAIMCKKCGFIFKDSEYFDPIPKGKSVPLKGRSPFKVRKGKWSG